jgi:hypothetical protein
MRYAVSLDEMVLLPTWSLRASSASVAGFDTPDLKEAKALLDEL